MTIENLDYDKYIREVGKFLDAIEAAGGYAESVSEIKSVQQNVQAELLPSEANENGLTSTAARQVSGSGGPQSA